MRDIMSAMTATLPSESVYHGKNLSGEKRLHGAYSVVAAFADGYAIRDAGIQLSESIDGVGDSAMEAAFLAIARAAAPDAASFLYVRHG